MQLFDELIKLKKDFELGFDPHHFPDKRWMINAIYNLDPKNSLFQ